MERIACHIKEIIFNFNGVFLVRERPVPVEVQDLYEDVFFNINAEGSAADKINMHSDVQKLKKDFKKAVKQYKEEHSTHE